MDEERRASAKAAYETTLTQRRAYLAALNAWKNDPAVRAAPQRLLETIRDLEKRGLLQYDGAEKRYDLHPVVRGVANGRMADDETQSLGQKLVDHFSQQPHDPWERAETLDDVASGLQIVRTLLRMGRFEKALAAYRGDLENALLFNLRAEAEIETMLRPFFPQGWDGEPVALDDDDLSYLLNSAALALSERTPETVWKLLEKKIALDLRNARASDVRVSLNNLGNRSYRSNRLAETARLHAAALRLAEAGTDAEHVFVATLRLFELAVTRGDRQEADRRWRALDAMGRGWRRARYRPGDAEYFRAFDLFYRGALTEEFLGEAERLARDGRNRETIEDLLILRGRWLLAAERLAAAVDSLDRAAELARAAGRARADVEALLALARWRKGEKFDARAEAERLDGKTSNLALAELWQALGAPDRAVATALRLHKWAVADGEPFVHRYYLERARALLTELGAEPPQVPTYDPATAVIYPGEKDVAAFIEKLEAERAAKEATKKK